MFQKDSALAQWFYERTKNAPQTCKSMICVIAEGIAHADRCRFLCPEGLPLIPARPITHIAQFLLL
jgi:hypothetical protein